MSDADVHVTARQVEKERRKILLVYVLAVAAIVCLTALAVYVGGKLLFWPLVVQALILLSFFTLAFLLSYRDPATWGWLLGRRRMFMGRGWQPRVLRDLSARDAASAAREMYEYDRSINYRKPDGLVDLRIARDQLRRIKTEKHPQNHSPRVTRGSGTMLCPQCGTPYVYDNDNRQCVACGFFLYDQAK